MARLATLGLLTLGLVAQLDSARADARAERPARPTRVPAWLTPELSQWSEVWGTPARGRRQIVYTGLLTFGLEANLDAAVGVRGLSVGCTGLWLQGDDLSASAVGDAGVTSNIAGVSTVRLFRAWLEQRLHGNVVVIRAGVLSIDDDFLVVDSADLFTHSGFGTAQTLALNLPSPIYPLGALGVRLALQPSPAWWVRMGVYDGSAGNPTVHRYASELVTGVEAGLTFLGEVGHGSAGSDTHLFAGAFFQAGKVLESSTRGLWGSYLMAETVLARVGGSELSGFAHASTAWPASRAVAAGYLDAGLSLGGALWRRPGDALGLAYGSTLFGRRYVGRRRALGHIATASEDVLEFTYRAALHPRLALQPVLQWIRDAHYTGRNSLVLGLRLALTLGGS